MGDHALIVFNTLSPPLGLSAQEAKRKNTRV